MEKTVDAVLISHSHGDHAGLLQYINPPIPVYIGEKACKILNITSKFTGIQPIHNPLNFLVSGQEIVIGDFRVTPYIVDHSGYDAYGFVIKAGDKCIAYTGDFRGHGRKKKALDYFVESMPQGIDGILIEGTMMSRAGEAVETEEDIERRAFDFMKSKPAPVFVLQSSTNIDRLVGMYKAAKRSGRIFVMDIFTAHIVSQLNDSIPKPGYFKDIKVFYPYYLTKSMFKTNEGAKLMKQFSQYRISRMELGRINNYCMLIRDIMLSDIQHIGNLNRAGFIYSMWSGYKKLERVCKLLSYAESKYMDTIDLHTSGHASLDTLQRIINGSNAGKVIPVHTEKPFLFTEYFKNVHIAKDEEVIDI